MIKSLLISQVVASGGDSLKLNCWKYTLLSSIINILFSVGLYLIMSQAIWIGFIIMKHYYEKNQRKLLCTGLFRCECSITQRWIFWYRKKIPPVNDAGHFSPVCSHFSLFLTLLFSSSSPSSELSLPLSLLSTKNVPEKKHKFARIIS